MISFDKALELVRSVATPLGTEKVFLGDAALRVLAEPVVAGIDSPRSDVSAMDGYAINDRDLDTLPVSLTVIGESFAGTVSGASIERGSCVRIFTGAPIPPGANRVIIQEEVRREGDRAIMGERPGPSRYIRGRGSDFNVGDRLLDKGRLLDARAIIAASAADLAELTVYRRPRVAIFSTGDELAEPGMARDTPGAIPDSVSPGIMTLARQWGCEIVGHERLKDDLSMMREAASLVASEADILVVTGGASVGERDFARTMFEPMGLELVFSKVSMKPGKPAWLGRAKGKLVMGLPGNPTSALVTARLLLAPLLAGVTGQPCDRALSWRMSSLLTALPACGERETFHRARLVTAGAEILSFQDSSAQKALGEADLLVRQPAGGRSLETGEPVQTLDF